MRLHAAVAAVLLVCAGVAPAAAMPPPRESTTFAGYDENGRAWLLAGSDERGAVVVGPRQHPVPGGLGATGVIAEGALWMPGAGQVTRVALADGRTSTIKVPARLVTHVAVSRGVLFATTADEKGGSALVRVDPATGRSAVLFETTGPAFLGVGIGARTAWIVTWTGLEPPRMQLELVGVPRDGGPPKRVPREVPWAERWQGLWVQEDAAGSVWIANAYAARVERMDPQGAWRTWTFAPGVISGFATSGTSGVAVVDRMTAAEGRPTGAPTHDLAERALVVLDPAAREPVRTVVPPGTPMRGLAAAGGRLWLGDATEVRLVDGRAVIGR